MILFFEIYKGAARPVLATNGQVFSYDDLFSAVTSSDALARGQGVVSGDVVLLVGGYTVEAVGWFFALASLGCIVVPATEATTGEDVQSRGEIAGARWRISQGTGWRPVPFSTETTPPLYANLRAKNHAGLVLFSSGSTGTPKAMLHDLTTLLGKYAGRRPKSLPVLAALLFDHIGGLNTLFGALASGQLLVAPPSHDPDAVASLIAEYKVAVLPTSPTFLNLLLLSGAADRHDLSSLRLISYGTEPMPAALLARAKEKFPRAKFIETFGTSETGIAKTRGGAGNTLQLDDPEVESRVVDGELWLRSKTQILGYLNHDMDRFTADGWFRTGDRVEVSPDGSMRILGRENDWINVGGEKVFPAEVESVLLEMPSVAECRVSGVSNPITGQSVFAEIVVQKNGPFENDPDVVKRAVRTHCRSRLEPFKVPTRVVIVETLPVSERGKRVRR